MLGIAEGVVRKTVTEDGKTRPADGKEMLYGLGLEDALKLDSELDRTHALAVVGKEMGIVRQIYKDLAEAALPESARIAKAAAALGPPPAYLTNQIANYQAALARLGG